MKKIISSAYVDKVVQNPSAVYLTPAADKRLTPAQKKKILKSWSRETRAILRSDDHEEETSLDHAQASKLLEAIKRTQSNLMGR